MATHSKPAVGYIRMSTDKQEDSPARQRKDIETLAERQGYRIRSWYEDHGVTGTESLNRPEFQRLLANAKNGKFEAVLVSEQSRMSREDIFDAMLHWKLLRDAGVRIVTSQRGELDFNNLGGVITAIVDQYGAREESVKLAHRVASGLRLKARQGLRIGGTVLGYDRELRDESGKVVKRVHFREKFRKPISWTSKLVLSDDKEAVKAVRWAFNSIHKGESVCGVMRGLNERGLRTTCGNPFIYSSTKSLLRNPTYAGVLRAGYYSRAKFCPLTDDGPIIVENAHDQIVSRAVFDEVQSILDAKPGLTSKPNRYMLSGIVNCHHCGNRMYGQRRKQRRKPDSEFGYTYECNTAPGNKRYDRLCPHPSVNAGRLEDFVLATIRERLLTGNIEKRIREAIVRAKRQDAKRATKDERKLADLRKKIERATENLALASAEDFAAIARLLAGWRDEEAELAGKIEGRVDELEPLPEALRVLNRFAEIPNNMAKADRTKLGNAIRQTIRSIEIRTGDAQVGDVKYRELVGELCFLEAFGIKPIAIPDEALGQRRIWREYGELVRQSKHPLHLKDFAAHINTPDMSHAAYHVRRSERAGLIEKVGHQGGWISLQRNVS